MRCPACAAENPPEHRFCENCGAALEQRCGECGAPARPAARFCGQCGAHLHGASEAEPAAPGADDAELARDYALAGEWAAALAHAERAGDLAADAFAYADAAEHYTAALAAAVHVTPPPVAVAALHVKRAGMRRRSGVYDAATEDYARALELVHDAGERREEAHVLLAMAEHAAEGHRRAAAEAHGEAALALASELDDRALQAGCLSTRAMAIAAWQGPIAAARQAARAALPLAEQIDDPPLWARCLVTLGAILQWRADFAACDEPLHEGAVLAERTQQGRLQSRAFFHLGHSALARGLYEEGLRWYAQLARHAQGGGDDGWRARSTGAVAGVHLELGDLDMAAERCREAEALAARAGGLVGARGHALVKLGLAELGRDELDAAAAALQRAVALLGADDWGVWHWHIPLLRARAELALARGVFDEAWELATRSLELAHQTDARKHAAHAQVVLGRIAAAQERLPEATQLLRGGIKLAEHLGTVRALWLGCAALGDVLVRAGHERDAEAYLTQAAQTVEAIAAQLYDPHLRASFLRDRPVTELYRLFGRRPPP